MLNLFKICKSLVKKNKSFTIGLFLMSLFSIGIGFVGLNIGKSTEDTTINFIESSNLPDSVYITNILPKSTKDKILEIEGVETVAESFLYEGSITLENGEIYPARIMTYDDKNPYKLQVDKSITITDDSIKCYFPIRFSRSHNINPGDQVLIDSPTGSFDAKIQSLVSSADGIYASKDFVSSHEGNSYSYVYICAEDFNKVYDVSNISNQWQIYINSNVTESQRNKIYSQIEEVFSSDLKSKTFFANSKERLLGLKSTIDAFNTLGLFFSIMTVAITLGFNFMFIRIIASKEKSLIGLLRALGFTKKKVVFVFCLYTVFINIIATIIGLPIGYLFLKISVLPFPKTQCMPVSILTISPLRIVALVLTVFLAGIISSVLASSTIAKIDPSEAYGNTVSYEQEPVKFLSKIKGKEFFKISISSIFRNISRHIIGAISIACCILLITAGFEGYATTKNIGTAVYGKRLLYDVAVRSIDNEAYQDMGKEINGIEIIEPNIFFQGNVNDESIIINAIQDDSKLVVLKDPKGNEIKPVNGIIIDELFAKKYDISVGDTLSINDYSINVDGIAREIVYFVWYINLDTARKMGYEEINGAMIKVSNIEQINDVVSSLHANNKSAYIIKGEDQKNYLEALYTSIETALLLLAGFAFAIGILLITNMSIIDFLSTRQKYASLRAIGYSAGKLTFINIIENVARILAGAIIGLPLSYGACTLLLSLLTSSSRQFIMVNFMPLFLLSVAISLLYILIAALITYRNIHKMDIVHYLNNGE